MKCDMCSIGNARYVCVKCGRKVCEECLDLRTWTCTKCLEIEGINLIEEEDNVINNIIKTSIIGFIVIFIGLMLIIISQLIMGGTIGGVIIFPFIPLIFFYNIENLSIVLMLMLIMLITFTIIVFILYRKI
ncbi:MAG: hypothetical protein N3E39_01035 [Candidatus Methanomethylicia archaeon]|nr:hypothetical protein [Candidatus Methanomethylicia archaeon]MDW7988532.1 hypothetical protein [Nitrososphaerota archaeon]